MSKKQILSSMFLETRFLAEFSLKPCLKGLYEVLLSNYDEINNIMNANQESIESDEETLSKMCDRAEKGGRISECPNVRISHKILFTIIV